MTKKTIELTDSAAIQIQAVEISDKNYLSIRKMYKTKKDKDWKPARQGMTLPWDSAEEILKRALKIVKKEDVTFTKLDMKKDD